MSEIRMEQADNGFVVITAQGNKSVFRTIEEAFVFIYEYFNSFLHTTVSIKMIHRAKEQSNEQDA